jgi:hypothetical protein
MQILGTVTYTDNGTFTISGLPTTAEGANRQQSAWWFYTCGSIWYSNTTAHMPQLTVTPDAAVNPTKLTVAVTGMPKGTFPIYDPDTGTTIDYPYNSTVYLTYGLY